MYSDILIKRLQKELRDLEREPPPGITCYPKEDNITELEAYIKGPPDTPYEKGLFKLDIQIPLKYPFEPPQIRFMTNIYHPNIDDGGRICADILKTGGWKPALNLSTTLISLAQLMAHPNPDDPLDAEIAKEYHLDYSQFRQKAMDYTEKYATGESNETIVSEELEKKQEHDSLKEEEEGLLVEHTQPKFTLLLSRKKKLKKSKVEKVEEDMETTETTETMIAKNIQNESDDMNTCTLSKDKYGVLQGTPSGSILKEAACTEIGQNIPTSGRDLPGDYTTSQDRREQDENRRDAQDEHLENKNTMGSEVTLFNESEDNEITLQREIIKRKKQKKEGEVMVIVDEQADNEKKREYKTLELVEGIELSDDDDDKEHNIFTEPVLHSLKLSKKLKRNTLNLSKTRK